MNHKFIKSTISIAAELSIIQKILTEYRYIKKWENGLDSWKELHISSGSMIINHWDIEDDIDYEFKLSEMGDNVLLELKIGDLSNQIQGSQNVMKVHKYVNTVLNRIKDMSENINLFNT